jgi:GNAT superfamily N-acetyltransferase
MVADDLSAVTRLCDQLGYPSPADEVADRLGRFDPRREQMIVALDEEGRVIGWVHVAEVRSAVLSRAADIGGLVVDQAHRGRGIGEELMAAAEAWAVDRGLERVDVRSNVIRVDAHRFYERIGYRKIKTSFVLRREIKGSPPNQPPERRPE